MFYKLSKLQVLAFCFTVVQTQFMQAAGASDYVRSQNNRFDHHHAFFVNQDARSSVANILLRDNSPSFDANPFSEQDLFFRVSLKGPQRQASADQLTLRFREGNILVESIVDAGTETQISLNGISLRNSSIYDTAIDIVHAFEEITPGEAIPQIKRALEWQRMYMRYRRAGQPDLVAINYANRSLATGTIRLTPSLDPATSRRVVHQPYEATQILPTEIADFLSLERAFREAELKVASSTPEEQEKNAAILAAKAEEHKAAFEASQIRSAELAKIPTVQTAAQKALESSGLVSEDCPVCLEPFEVGQIVVRHKLAFEQKDDEDDGEQKYCKQPYHPDCYDQLIEHSPRCAIDRTKIGKELRDAIELRNLDEVVLTETVPATN